MTEKVTGSINVNINKKSRRCIMDFSPKTELTEVSLALQRQVAKDRIAEELMIQYYMVNFTGIAA